MVLYHRRDLGYRRDVVVFCICCCVLRRVSFIRQLCGDCFVCCFNYAFCKYCFGFHLFVINKSVHFDLMYLHCVTLC